MAHLESEAFIDFVFCCLKRFGIINVRIWFLFTPSEVGPVKPHTQPVPATLLASERWISLHHLSICIWSILNLYWKAHWFELNQRNWDLTSFLNYMYAFFIWLTFMEKGRKSTLEVVVVSWVHLYKELLQILATWHTLLVASHWFINRD